MGVGDVIDASAFSFGSVMLTVNFTLTVLGVGMAKGISAINLSVVGQIFLSWVITIPAGAILSVIFFFIIRALLG